MFSGRKIRVVPYRHHPRLRWTIAGYRINNKRVRRFFATKGEAETFVQQLAVKAENLGTRVAHIDQNLHVMAVQCSDRLKPFGRTLADATDFLIRHLEAIERSCSIDDLISRFLDSKRADGVARRYEQELRSRLGQFLRSFAGRNAATITTLEIDDWLRSLGSAPLTRNHSRRILHVLFSYAVARKLCPANPVTETSKAKVLAPTIEVLTPEQTKRLLDCADPELRPALAIGAFAGLRPAEIARLDWREVKLDRGYIEVTAAKSKTASRRLVKILPNLKAWLQTANRPSGDVLPPNSRKFVDAARIRAGLAEWPSNGLRHSYASYHLAKFQDAAALALEMGHTTTAMLFSHYREVVTPEDAEAYWSIAPATS
jgi:integrase